MKKILIVDDDTDLLALLEDSLGAAGYQAQTCRNGRQCLESLKAFKPDLLILDVMLPGIDGYTLRHQISQDEESRSIPVIVLTGLEPSRTLFKGIPQVTAFLTKPFKTEELLKEIGKALGAAQ